MLSLFTKNAGAPKLLRFGTPTFIVEPFFIALEHKRELPFKQLFFYTSN